MEGRISRLDSFLLFAASSISLGFAVGHALIGGIVALVIFLPLLSTVWFMSIYVGYVRGAILMNSLAERVAISDHRKWLLSGYPVPWLPQKIRPIFRDTRVYTLSRFQYPIRRNICRISRRKESQELADAAASTSDAAVSVVQVGVSMIFSGFLF